MCLLSKEKYAVGTKPVIIIGNLKHLGLDIIHLWQLINHSCFYSCSFGLVMSLLLMNEEGPKYLSQVYIILI